MVEIDKIYNEDCLEGMKRIPDCGVDCCITSPPYNFNLRIHYGKYGGWGSTDKNKYGDKFIDRMPIEEYFEWQKSCIDEMLRISKNLVFYNIQMITGNKVALCKLIGHFAENVKEIMIWDKIHAEPAVNDGVLNSMYEFVMVFSKKNAIARQFDVFNAGRGTFGNIIRLQKNRQRNEISHKAVFPVQLPQTLIHTFTKEGDIVCDPFMGLGTTGVACINENRHYVGFEINREYFDLAEKRLDDERRISEL